MVPPQHRGRRRTLRGPPGPQAIAAGLGDMTLHRVRRRRGIAWARGTARSLRRGQPDLYGHCSSRSSLALACATVSSASSCWRPGARVIGVDPADRRRGPGPLHRRRAVGDLPQALLRGLPPVPAVTRRAARHRWYGRRAGQSLQHRSPRLGADLHAPAKLGAPALNVRGSALATGGQPVMLAAAFSWRQDPVRDFLPVRG